MRDTVKRSNFINVKKVCKQYCFIVLILMSVFCGQGFAQPLQKIPSDALSAAQDTSQVKNNSNNTESYELKKQKLSGSMVMVNKSDLLNHGAYSLKTLWVMGGLFLSIVCVVVLWFFTFRIFFKIQKNKSFLVFGYCLNILLTLSCLYDLALYFSALGETFFYVSPVFAPLIMLFWLGCLVRNNLNSQAEKEEKIKKLQAGLASQDKALRESYSRLRLVEQRALLSKERQRLMRDMHDGLGSSLTGAIHMARESAPHSALLQTLQDCLYELKITVDSLESVDSDLLVLLANLRYRLAPRFKSYGIALEWAVTTVPPLQWLTPSAALHILRIVQEVITNILKHAQCNTIRVSTAAKNNAVLIVIENNGKSFTAEQQTAGGRGLRNIRWRAQVLNSRVNWSALTEGTRFTLWMPLEQPEGAVTTLSPGISAAALKERLKNSPL